MSNKVNELLELLREAEEAKPETKSVVSENEQPTSEPSALETSEIEEPVSEGEELDPEIAEILKSMEEDSELEIDDSEVVEESDSDAPATETEVAAESKEDFNSILNIALSEEEVNDLAAQVATAASAAKEDESEEESEEEVSDEDEASADAEGESALPATESLSKEQKFMVKRLFDESVAQAVAAKLPTLIKLTEEKLNSKMQDACRAHETKLNEQVSHYLEYVVETWRKENEPKLYTAAQVKVAQKIFESVKALVETFDIETVDISAQLIDMYEQKISKLEGDSNKLVSENASLVKEVSLRDRALIIEEASKGLPLTEIENFKAVVAKIKADDLETFRENVSTMKASFMPKTKKTENVRVANETLALQGGIRNQETFVKTEADLIANLIPAGFENNK